MQQQAFPDPGPDRRIARVSQRDRRDVDALSLEPWMGGQRAQEPFSAPTAEIEDPFGAPRYAVPKKPPHRVVM